MAVDATKRPLIINPRFVPYIDKHRIYDLLYDISTNLAIRKPKDHILFIRNLLEDINDIRDKPRILVLTPPHISGHKLAAFLSKETAAKIISFSDVLEESEEDISPAELAFRLCRLIEKEDVVKTGWIMHDIPRDYMEGKILQKYGVFPTHTFEICASPEQYSKNDAWFENIKDWPLNKFKEAMALHTRKMFGIRKAFESTYKMIPVNARTLKELARECIEVTKEPIFKGAPLLPRVVLIGTRGSRRRTVAKGLKQKYNIVHIDLEELILQGLKSDNEIGEQLRRLERRQSRIYSKLVLTMLQRRLLQRDCMRNGWVLTSFPRDLDDFRALDDFDTPPNKVIFLSVETSKAFKRLKDRRINAYTGIVKSVDEIKKDMTDDIKEYIIHPRDHKVNVLKEQEEFDTNFQSMLEYCGDSCNVVNADGSDEEVIERISKILMQPLAIAPPRRPLLQPKQQQELNKNTFTLPTQSCTTIYPSQLEKPQQKWKDITEREVCL